MTRTLAPAFVVGLAVVAGASSVSAAPVLLPGDGASAAVTSLGVLETVEGLGVSADGATAAAAVPSRRSPGRSAVRIARSGLPVTEIELDGRVEGLAMPPGGDAVFLVVRATDKKGAVRRVSLVRIDPATGRLAEVASLPSTAHGLALGAGDGTLLVAAKDEIRSFTLPAIASGPLYRLLGDNLAVAALAGSTRVLVAQGRRIALADLASAQDRDGLKPDESVDAAASVRTLVASPDEPAGLALLDDGRVVTVGLEPLRVVDRGTARAIAWPGVRAPAAPQGGPAEPEAPAEPEPPVEPKAPAEPDVSAAVPQAAVAVAAAGAPPEPTVPEAPPPAAPPTPTPETPPRPPVGDAEQGTVRGSVDGPARGAVLAIVLLGPDNILKEAARAVPGPSGRWTVSGLPTGTYRVVAAGDAGHVLICDPPYVMVRVGAGGAVEAPTLNAIRVH